MENVKILLVFGTRPEAIKMAPVYLALKKDKQFDVRICVSAQHRQMLDDVLTLFNINPEYDLNLMQAGQDLTDINCGVLSGLRTILQRFKPDRVLVHGDTTTAFSATLAAFYQQIPVAHVEAGLRTNNLSSPWHEEANRCLIGKLADLHFVPTLAARQNLLKENIDPATVYLTGNTVIDALQEVVSKIQSNIELRTLLAQRFPFFMDAEKNHQRMILVTGHRRENHGEGMLSICRALQRLAKRRDVMIVYPVHPNPHVQNPVKRLLAQEDNIHLLEPLDYVSFVYLLTKADVILTDSGGIQEEAPSLGKPVLVMRDTTERPEAVAVGAATLVGTNEDTIVNTVANLLDTANYLQATSCIANPYGDGLASQRIVHVLRQKHQLTDDELCSQLELSSA